MTDLATSTMNASLATSQALAAQSQAQLSNAGKPATTANDDKIGQAAQEYENVFVGEMLRHAFDTVPQDGMFSGGQGENVARSMLTQEYAKKIGEAGGIGLADHVKSELIRLQASKVQQ